MKIKPKEFFLSIFIRPSIEVESWEHLSELQSNFRLGCARVNIINGMLEIFNAANKFNGKNILLPVIAKYERVNYGQYDKVIRRLKIIDHSIKEIVRIYEEKNRGDVTINYTSHGSFEGMKSFESATLMIKSPPGLDLFGELNSLINRKALPVINSIDSLPRN